MVFILLLLFYWFLNKSIYDSIPCIFSHSIIKISSLFFISFFKFLISSNPDLSFSIKLLLLVDVSNFIDTYCFSSWFLIFCPIFCICTYWVLVSLFPIKLAIFYPLKGLLYFDILLNFDLCDDWLFLSQNSADGFVISSYDIKFLLSPSILWLLLWLVGF